MIESEREKLRSKTGEYLSIGITSGGVPRMSVGIPWEATSHAYNMRTPNVYITPEDLQDEAIMQMLESCKLIGCYIWAPLNDYTFLARFKDLQDINIKNGDAITNLDFLSELYECRMLCLQNAKLQNLDVIVEVKKNSTAKFGCLKCIGLDNSSRILGHSKIRLVNYITEPPTRIGAFLLQQKTTITNYGCWCE